MGGPWQLGVTAERARAEVRRLFAAPAPPDSDDPLTSVTVFAHRRGDGYVDTEHVLFVLATTVVREPSGCLRTLASSQRSKRNSAASSHTMDHAGSYADSAPDGAAARSAAEPLRPHG
ncbi:MAG: hypothetical protein M3460_07720 [Actinomycetota bacterium]|nr:hypothetical protein [Actinomycetota bacterium]